MLTIVSAGQTGVDRAALDVAIELGIAYRGWCPKGGWAEDRPSPPGVLALYPGLGETPHADPRQRTEWNVRDCDRLMVLVEPRRALGVERHRVCAGMRQGSREASYRHRYRCRRCRRPRGRLSQQRAGALGGQHRRPARKRGPRHLCLDEGILEPPAGAPNLRGRSPVAL